MNPRRKEKSEEIGKLLADLLREAVAFESSKKRGKLERNPDHIRITPLRVYVDVLVAIKRAESNSKPPRPTGQIKRFRELLAELGDDTFQPVIEPWVWPWLDVSEEHEEQNFLADRDALVSRLEDTEPSFNAFKLVTQIGARRLSVSF